MASFSSLRRPNPAVCGLAGSDAVGGTLGCFREFGRVDSVVVLVTVDRLPVFVSLGFTGEWRSSVNLDCFAALAAADETGLPSLVGDFVATEEGLFLSLPLVTGHLVPPAVVTNLVADFVVVCEPVNSV